MTGTNENKLGKYVNAWNGRLKAVMLEFIILHKGAYDPDPPYPYSIAQALEEEWGPNSVPLTTIYSAINRLDDMNLIDVKGEIVNGRVQKNITTRSEGFEVLKELQTSILEQCRWFSHFEDNKVI